MLELIFIVLATAATIRFVNVAATKVTFNEDVFYIRRLDLFPEFLAEWEKTVDSKILVARTTPPSINGVKAPLPEHKSANLDDWFDEWDETEAYADQAYFASCESGHPLSMTQF